MKITIITLGKLKEKFYRSAQEEFLKRLSAWAKIEIIEIKEESFNEKDKAELVKQKEAEKIKKHLPDNCFSVILDEKGQTFTSVEFAEKIKKITDSDSHICFVIGGPLGLSKEISEMGNLKLSLSKMTFTHQMIRIFLLEQVYRAFTIIKGKKYHY